MKKPLFSVYDKVAELYTVPFLEATDGTARRIIQDQMARPESMLGKHPQDYRLDRLGMFDEVTGELNQDSKTDLIELEILGD